MINFNVCKYKFHGTKSEIYVLIYPIMIITDESYNKLITNTQQQDIDTEDQIKFHYHACYFPQETRFQQFYDLFAANHNLTIKIQCHLLLNNTTIANAHKHKTPGALSLSFTSLSSLLLTFCCLHFECEMNLCLLLKKLYCIIWLFYFEDMHHLNFMVIKLLMPLINFSKCLCVILHSEEDFKRFWECGLCLGIDFC